MTPARPNHPNLDRGALTNDIEAPPPLPTPPPPDDRHHYRTEMTIRFAIWDQATGAAGQPAGA